MTGSLITRPSFLLSAGSGLVMSFALAQWGPTIPYDVLHLPMVLAAGLLVLGLGARIMGRLPMVFPQPYVYQSTTSSSETNWMWSTAPWAPTSVPTICQSWSSSP
jgi:hypothetical protein